MSYLNTELVKALQENLSIEEIFRNTLETAVNDVLSSELAAFLGYGKYNYEGRNTGNSRNGFYERSLDTKFGTINLKIPRDRNGEFHQKLIPDYTRHTDSLEDAIVTLYGKGITTGEIAAIIENIYGHHYSKATISNITQNVQEAVTKFHNRTVKERYAVVYCDATFINLRRDSVAREALHVMLGITPDGYKEVLDYAVYPTEGTSNYNDMLKSLKSRGLKQVLLFVSDGLNGIRDALLKEFPDALHQRCWIHIARNIASFIRVSDRKKILGDLKEVYKIDQTVENAEQALENFIEKYKSSYKKFTAFFEDRSSLFSFLEFPESIRRSIYNTNLIERSNKTIKKAMNKKEQFPNEDSLERFVCTVYSDYNKNAGIKKHKGFNLASAVLIEMFEKNETTPGNDVENHEESLTNDKKMHLRKQF